MAGMNTAAESSHHSHEVHCRLCLETSWTHGDRIDITENINKTILELFPPEMLSFQSTSMFICEPCLESVNSCSSFLFKIVGRHRKLLGDQLQFFPEIKMEDDPISAVVIKTEMVEDFATDGERFTAFVDYASPSTSVNAATRRSQRSFAPESLTADNESAFRRAIREVSNGISIRKAARIHGIPNTTLGKHLKNPNPSERRGCPPLLRPAEELEMKSWILDRASHNQNVHHTDILKEASAILQRRVEPSAKEPSRSWLNKFIERHCLQDVTTPAEPASDVKDEMTLEESLKRLKALNYSRQLIACELCGRSVQRNSYFSHKQSHSTIRLVCDLCGNNFSGKRNLQRHLRRHIPKVFRLCRFQCQICKVHFYSSDSMRSHTKIKHLAGPTTSFDCIDCEKSFKAQSAFNYHKKMVHSQEDTRKECEMCGKVCSTQYTLTCHIKTSHSKAPKDLMCSDCGKLFRHQKELTSHQRSHREKTFMCEFVGCDKKYRTDGDLKEHQKKAHLNLKDFKCSHEGCDKAFYTAQKLKNHFRLKHENLRQKCPIGGCSFHVGRRDYMRNHLKKHTELTTSELDQTLEVVRTMELV